MCVPRNNPRVLQLVHSLDVGGLEQVVVDLCAGLTAVGVECYVGCLSHAGQKFAQAHVAGSWIGNERAEKRPLDFKTLGQLLRYIKEEAIDIVHSHNPQAHYYGAAVAFLAGVTHIHTVHGRGNPLATKLRRRTWLRRILARWTDHIVAVSDDVRTKLLTVDRLPSRKITTILNGVDVRHYCPVIDDQTRVRLRQQRNIPGEAFVIGSIGRLSREKNYPLLIDSFARVSSLLQSTFLVLVGEGAERSYINKCILDEQIGSRCLLAGSQSDIFEWMQCFDVFCLPSDTEGTAITLLEAMATGVPIVATDVGGSRAVVNPPECGMIVAPGDPIALAAAIVELARDEGRRGQVSSAERRRAELYFSRERMIEKHLVLYKASLNCIS